MAMLLTCTAKAHPNYLWLYSGHACSNRVSSVHFLIVVKTAAL
jgi:hypothetical protein